MNFLLSVNYDFKNKSSVEKIHNFERFLSLVIIVGDVLRKEKIHTFTSYEQNIKKLIKNNVFGLCKKDYKFLFKTIKTLTKVNNKVYVKTKTNCIHSLLCDGKLYIIADYIVELKEKYNINIDFDKTIEELNKIWFE